MANRFKANQNLRQSVAKSRSVESVKSANNIPAYNAKNDDGHGAYSIEDKLLLVSRLNTWKIEDTFYKSAKDQVKEFQELIEKVVNQDVDFVAKAITASRCKLAKMRSVNHLAAAILANYISGKEYATRFFSNWNKKNGCIYRLDDMAAIQTIYKELTGHPLTNAMKKGFRNVLNNADLYQISKYKKTAIDIANLVHPNNVKSKVEIEINGEKKMVDAIYALRGGYPVEAETWESAQTEAGQIVAEAVKAGKITKEEATEKLNQAKSDNWRQLLDEGKLGILAALRNLKNILLTHDSDIVDKVCNLVSNDGLLREKIMPYQIDLAYEKLVMESSSFYGSDYRKVLSALETGIEKSVSNLKELLIGRNLVMVDCSGSMTTKINFGGNWGSTTCSQKAALIAAMILKSTNADLVQFGSTARYKTYNPNDSVFSISSSIKNDSMGGTSLSSAFNLIEREKKSYDRIFILSDNECNYGCQRTAYKSYVRNVADPYIYSIDLAANGTKPLENEGKVSYLFGYSYAMFDQVKTAEFNPMAVMDIINAIEL